MEVRGYMDGGEAIFFGSGFRWARARMEVRYTFLNLCGSVMVSLWIWDAIVGAWLKVRCHLDGGDMQLWGPGLGWDSIWMKVSRESGGLNGVERGVDGSETQMPRYLDGGVVGPWWSWDAIIVTKIKVRLDQDASETWPGWRWDANQWILMAVGVHIDGGEVYIS